MAFAFSFISGTDDGGCENDGIKVYSKNGADGICELEYGI